MDKNDDNDDDHSLLNAMRKCQVMLNNAVEIKIILKDYWWINVRSISFRCLKDFLSLFNVFNYTSSKHYIVQHHFFIAKQTNMETTWKFLLYQKKNPSMKDVNNIEHWLVNTWSGFMVLVPFEPAELDECG